MVDVNFESLHGPSGIQFPQLFWGFTSKRSFHKFYEECYGAYCNSLHYQIHRVELRVGNLNLLPTILLSPTAPGMSLWEDVSYFSHKLHFLVSRKFTTGSKQHEQRITKQSVFCGSQGGFQALNVQNFRPPSAAIGHQNIPKFWDIWGKSKGYPLCQFPRNLGETLSK